MHTHRTHDFICCCIRNNSTSHKRDLCSNCTLRLECHSLRYRCRKVQCEAHRQDNESTTARALVKSSRWRDNTMPMLPWLAWHGASSHYQGRRRCCTTHIQWWHWKVAHNASLPSMLYHTSRSQTKHIHTLTRHENQRKCYPPTAVALQHTRSTQFDDVCAANAIETDLNFVSLFLFNIK